MEEEGVNGLIIGGAIMFGDYREDRVEDEVPDTPTGFIQDFLFTF